ncbi:HIT domain-containing protein [Phreatobacter sp.]|uniref:HIT domain-containing protein n=1 Tax=Phreatobacter sp. TaxID=1966341 RepID=UPI003F705855
MSGDAFHLDPRLEADTFPVTDLPLCTVRLMNDATYPWLVLVPRRTGAVELIDLSRAERNQAMDEIALASDLLQRLTACEKLNVAALGNMVRQLHIHVIGRFAADPAWPGPVWGKVPARPYGEAARTGLTAALAAGLSAA